MTKILAEEWAGLVRVFSARGDAVSEDDRKMFYAGAFTMLRIIGFAEGADIPEDLFLTLKAELEEITAQCAAEAEMNE